MSVQFNFFGCGDDNVRIADAALEIFPGLLTMRERGTPEEVFIRDAEMTKDILCSGSSELQLLVPSEFRAMVKITHTSGNTACVRVSENPVIEFSPSTRQEFQVRIGRFYYACENTSELRSRVMQLFRMLKRIAAPYQGKRGLWIFPEALATAETLKQWVGPAWTNAMRTADPKIPSNDRVGGPSDRSF